MDIIAFMGFSEPFSSLSHLVGAFVSTISAAFLVRRGWGDGLKLASLVIYAFSVTFLLSMSGVYHLLEPGGFSREVLQRLDHAGIWLLILGTFTPVHTILFKGFWRWGILSVVWGVGILGLVLEVIFIRSIPEWLSLCFFLLLGWVGLISAVRTRKEHPQLSLLPLSIGGVAYSVGAVLDFMRWPVLLSGVFAWHEFFHVCVLIGIAAHWYFVLKIASFAPYRKQTEQSVNSL